MARRSSGSRRTTTATRPTAQRRNVPTQSNKPVPAKTTNTPASTSQPGLMSYIGANIVSNAVGYAAGRSLYDAFSGRGGEASADAVQEPNDQYRTSNSANCEIDTKNFMNCMRENHDDITACQFYFEMMKRCTSGQDAVSKELF